jgi:preprotein translocase subunit SecY
MLRILRDIWKIPDLRRRIFWTLGLLTIFRCGFFLYLPGVDVPSFLHTQQNKGGALDWLIYTSALTGGNLQTPVLFALGIMPYISASIIFSLMIKVFPRLEALSKEGEAGRRQINKYTRYFTVILCLIQSYFLIHSWQNQPVGSNFLAYTGFWPGLVQMLTLSVGSLTLMWLGEKITEIGIGNGTSLIIMVGIIADMPGQLARMGRQIQNAEWEQIPFEVSKGVILVLLYLAVVAGVVFITKGQRRIPIQQQRAVRGRRFYGGARSYMPIKVNAAGVLPIIFAQSLVVIPSSFLGWAAYRSDNFFFSFLKVLANALSRNGFLYIAAYIGLIFFFTYFWTTLMFNPVEIAGNLKEYGSFIPGIRPGRFTAEYLQRVIKRITIADAAFLTAIALTPQLVTSSLEIDYQIAYMLGGTGILIVVGVALDLVDKIEAQLLVRQYEGFMRGGEGPKRGGPEKKPVPSV